MEGLRSGLCDLKREGRAFGGPAVNGFCAAAQPGQGNQPQTGALTAAANLPDCEESSSCSVRPLLRLAARMSQTRWAAINRTAGAQAHLVNPASDIETSAAQVGADCVRVHCDVLERAQTTVCL
jgi:hypothetical protein